MVACGIGCRRGTPLEDIEAAISATRELLGCSDDIAVVATETSKADEPGIRALADRLGVRLIAFSADELRSVEAALLTVSHATRRHMNTPSVSEAAALLAAGVNARLLGPRFASSTTTCAFAVGDGGAS